MSARKLTCLQCGQINRLPAERLSDGPKCAICGAGLMPDKPQVVDFETLQKAIRSDEVPLLVDFWAPWCGPCRMVGPEFERAAKLLAGQVRLAKIDTERFPQALTRWNIRGIPAFILFSGGREQRRLAGAQPAQALVDFARKG